MDPVEVLSDVVEEIPETIETGAEIVGEIVESAPDIIGGIFDAIFG